MKRKIKEIVVNTLAILALMAAASDGPYFPWPNLIGVTVLAVIVCRVWIRIRRKRFADLNLTRLHTAALKHPE